MRSVGIKFADIFCFDMLRHKDFFCELFTHLVLRVSTEISLKFKFSDLSHKMLKYAVCLGKA